MNQLTHFKANTDEVEQSYQKEYPCNDAVDKKYIACFKYIACLNSRSKFVGLANSVERLFGLPHFEQRHGLLASPGVFFESTTNHAKK